MRDRLINLADRALTWIIYKLDDRDWLPEWED